MATGLAQQLLRNACMVPISQWPASERPRERLLSSGAAVLSDAELLALILGATSRSSGGALETSRWLLRQFGGLSGLARCQPGELMRQRGIGLARACALVAVGELGRRLESEQPQRGAAITCAVDAYRRVKPLLSLQRQELFLVLALDAKHRLIALHRAALGSATSVEVHPREVFGPTVREAAAAVIVAHNHPSGDPEPSSQDRELTRRLVRAGQVLGIPLLDHLVVGQGSFVSLAERGLIDPAAP